MGKPFFLLSLLLALSLSAWGSILFKSGEIGFHQDDPNSCVGRCNRSGTIPDGCQCNTACMQFGDCCEDYPTLCLPPQQEGSCLGKCGMPVNPSWTCQCNSACQNFGDCCQDYDQLCGGTEPDPITNADLEALGEAFFALEGPNNVAQWVEVNLQGETCSGCDPDLAPLPLLTVDPRAYEQGTVGLMVALFDNYVAAVGTPEDRTQQERDEEDAFIDALWATPIFTTLNEFLVEKGVDFSRGKFKQMWFDLYSRSGSTLGSSGFEHVFLGEIKSGVSGFHGWAFWGKEEEALRLNYRGWMKYADLSPKGSLVQHNFLWLGQEKPISSMFVGTSPEFEMAVFTACWLARPGSNNCPMSFGGTKVKVTTYTIGAQAQFVASAYPDPL